MFSIFRAREDQPQLRVIGVCTGCDREDAPLIEGKCAGCVLDAMHALELRPTRDQYARLRDERDDFHRRLCISQAEYLTLKHQFDQLWDANRTLIRDLRAARRGEKPAENTQKTA